ncbi:hypothetical protein [Hyphomicrobium sulfonivorans]|uniref:hypothetical protein n=1 Tax=Hyphomicrobium sulfonivorans TaxID=121290 RepID=UPI001FEA3240|nr:hypothetical protein [Hyphomicrobium sulfonivorans]NSL71922.1 hypothetical protein [Hyphomicrobium sulfonivorans]
MARRIFFRRRPISRVVGVCLGLALCGPVFAPSAFAVDAPATEGDAPAPLKMHLDEYRELLATHNRAWEEYEKIAAPYWQSVTEKRSRRRTKMANGLTLTEADYVMEQPPAFTGPPKPENPLAPKTKSPIPDVQEFLAAAKAEFDFEPERPQSEVAFKRAYAQFAAARGIEAKVAVKIYAFEAGGDGQHDIQAGREHDPKGKVISTALGYNQLLTTNTIGLLAEAGSEFVGTLKERAAIAQGARRQVLESKIANLRKMVAFARTVPNDWNAHGRLASTPKGIGVHALNLDIDIGPMLQTRKLTNSINFAKAKGYEATLTAAELEMMNLTGDGNGFDMLTMPPILREIVPTSNFFQRGGYERNPVAARNNTVSKLLAATDEKMEREMRKQGAQDLAAAFDAVTLR